MIGAKPDDLTGDGENHLKDQYQAIEKLDQILSLLILYSTTSDDSFILLLT